jgi:hypothetical protein
MEETQARMRKLAKVPLAAHRKSAGEELSEMRTITLPQIIKETASADFDVLLGPGGKVEGVSFSRGSELLRDAGEDLKKAPIKQPFPLDSSAKLVRRGVLSCNSYSGCSFVFYPAQETPSVN